MVFSHGLKRYIYAHFLEHRLLQTLFNGFWVEECFESGTNSAILVLVGPAGRHDVRDGPLPRSAALEGYVDLVRHAHVHETLLVQPCGPARPETVDGRLDAEPLFGFD